MLLLPIANYVNVILEKRESVFTNDCDRYNCNLELMELRFEGHPPIAADVDENRVVKPCKICYNSPLFHRKCLQL